MKEKLKKLKKLFNTNKSGHTFCFSLVCWTDGLWSVKVTDDWHKWIDKNKPMLDYKYQSPELAIDEFFKHIKKYSIIPKRLQEKKE